MRPRPRRTLALVISTLLAGACSGESPLQPDPDPVAVSTVAVSPDSASVQVGATQPYSAQTLGPGGESLSGRSVAWSTADASIAAVNGSTGLVTGVAPGMTVLRAVSEGITGSAMVAVTAVPVASVVVAPGSATLEVADTVSFAAQTLDAGGAVLPGRQVRWATIDGAVASVDSLSGLVTAVAEGTTSVVATSEGIADTASVVVVDTSPPAGVRAWRTDASDTNWQNPGNWVPAGVPAPSDTALIRAGANQPVLSAAAAVAKLQLEAGASVSLSDNTLTVSGDVDAGSPGISGPGTLDLSGSGTVSGTVPELVVRATRSLAGTVAVSGDVTVTSSGQLEIGAATMTVAGELTTLGQGRVLMTDASGVLDVEGSVTFSGFGQDSDLTAGELRVAGDFTQETVSFAASFAASATHQTVLDGTGPQTVSFVNPSPGQSHFGTLIITGSDVTLASTVWVLGDANVTAASAVTGVQLRVLGSLTSVAGSSITPSVVAIGEAMSIAGTFSPATTEFTGAIEIQPGLGYQNVIVSAGTASAPSGTVAASGDVTMTGAGDLEIGAATMTVAGDLTTLGQSRMLMTDASGVLDVEGSVTFSGFGQDSDLTAGELRVAGDFTQETVSFAASFAASAAHQTILDGTGPQTVSFVNPSPGQSHFGTLIITGSDVTLASTVWVLGDANVTVASAVTGVQLRVLGSLTSVAGSSITPSVVAIGEAMSIAGTFSPATTEFTGAIEIQPGLGYQNVIVSAGTASAPSGTVAASGDVTMTGAGDLEIGAATMTVAGDLTTLGQSRMLMTDASGVLDVEGSVTFSGFGQDSDLTAGELRVAGDFTQATVSFSASFAASAAHQTILDGTGPQTVSFVNPSPGQSHFGTLIITGSDVTFVTNGFVLGSATLSGSMTLLAPFTMDIAANFTLESGASLVNDGTILVGGICTDNGATVTGTGTGNVPCVQP